MDPQEFDGMSHKRGHDDGGMAGSGKRLATNGEGEIVYRLLCAAAKSGSVIGKGGSIIKQLRDETGARIKVAEAVPGSEERVVVISGPETLGTPFCPAQEALFRVHSRLTEGDAGFPGGAATARLLVPSSQIGCILGKGGSIIAELRQKTGAQIRILPKDQLPACALPTDETLQLAGEPEIVFAALQEVSARLRANPPRDRNSLASNTGGAYNQPPMFSRAQLAAPGLAQGLGMAHPDFGFDGQGLSDWQFGAQGAGMSRSGVGAPAMPSMGGEVTFRILCPSNRIGAILGKAGSIIKQLRDETGARIKVAEPTEGVDERVVIITAGEDPSAQFSPSQEALFRVHSRVIEGLENPMASCSLRLLVPTSQVGCLLGKGGSIISEIRRSTGANVRILPKDDVPGCAQKTDELVQVSGPLDNVRAALLQVALRLRANPPRDRSQAGGLASSGQGSQYQQRGPPSNGAAGMLGGGAAGFDGPPQQTGWVQPFAGSGNLGQGLSASTFSSFGQAAGQGPVGGGPLPSALSHTVTISFPSHVAGVLVGKGGENIKKIRMLSNARVRLPEPSNGHLAERAVEISGTPEQIRTASDLVHAFIAQAMAGVSGQPPALQGGGAYNGAGSYGLPPPVNY